MDTNTPAGGPAGPDAPGARGEHGAPTAPYGTPPPFDSAPRPPAAGGFFAAVRRTGMFRGDDRWIGGVCDGLARRFGLDPLLVRGLFAASILLGGLGLVVYGVAWALLPEQSDGRIHLEEMVAGRFDVALLGALGVAIVGLARGDHWFWFWDGPPGWLQGLLWVAFIAGVIALIVTAASRRSTPAPVYGPAPYGPAPAAAAPADPWVKQPAPARAAAATAGPVGPTTSAPAPGAPGYPAPGAPAVGGPVTGPAPYGPYGPYPTPGSSGPYRQGPTPPAPPAPPVPLVPPPPPAPRKPRMLGPGVGMVGSVVALSLIGLAVLLLLDWTGDFDGPVALTALGIGIVLAGLGIIVSGLRGRRSGALGALAIVGILVAVPVGAARTNDWVWTSGPDRHLDSGTYLVDSRRAAADGFDFGFGDAVVDLTAVPLTSTTLDVPVSLGAGDLTVIVPTDAAVAADVEAGVGTVRWELDGETRTVDGLGISEQTFEDEQTRNGTTAQLLLHVSVGAGEVRIIEEQA